MSLAAKQRMASILIGFVLCWPFLHFPVVRHLNLDPWKFCGFAMYAAPHRSVAISVFAWKEGRIERVRLAKELGLAADPELTRRMHRFMARREVLHNLVEPRFIAMELLERRPDWEGVRIDLALEALNARTGYIERIADRYDYPR